MARSPASDSGPENYLFVVVGVAEQSHLAVETKTTTNSSSTFAEAPWPSADAELRLCRMGSQFSLS